jgi:hypothetical protein
VWASPSSVTDSRLRYFPVLMTGMCVLLEMDVNG